MVQLFALTFYSFVSEIPCLCSNPTSRYGAKFSKAHLQCANDLEMTISPEEDDLTSLMFCMYHSRRNHLTHHAIRRNQLLYEFIGS